MNYISISQAAQKLNVSERYVRRLCQDGVIIGAAKVGKTWIVPEDTKLNQKPTINVVFGGMDNIGFEISTYLCEKGEHVCFISNDEKQVLKAIKEFGNCTHTFIYNADGANEEDLLKIKENLSKYTISKLVFTENNSKFDKVENNTFDNIYQNFRGPIYTSVLACSIFYDLMDESKIICILHEKATKQGLANETAHSAAYHGMDGFFDSIYKTCETDDKVSHVLKVYTGAVDSDFWASDDASNVKKYPSGNKISPRDIARIAIDNANNKNAIAIAEIYARRIK